MKHFLNIAAAALLLSLSISEAPKASEMLDGEALKTLMQKGPWKNVTHVAGRRYTWFWNEDGTVRLKLLEDAELTGSWTLSDNVLCYEFDWKSEEAKQTRNSCVNVKQIGENRYSRFSHGDPVVSKEDDFKVETVAAEPKRLPFEPEMVKITGGTFQMGCVSDKGCRSDELPVHEVSIKPFEMGKYEVTFDQWDECVKQKGCQFDARKFWGGGKQPVVSMSWDDTQEYVSWLSEKTGKKYRLPTEAEWEYAARAGTKTPFSTGECLHTDQANYKGDFEWEDGNCPATDKNRKQPLEVGSFAANSFGLFDMHGNLQELVQDCYHKNYEGAPSDGSAWETDCFKKSGSVSRVMRGGGWIFIQENARSARRNWLGQAHQPQFTHGLGFRVARSL